MLILYNVTILTSQTVLFIIIVCLKNQKYCNLSHCPCRRNVASCTLKSAWRPRLFPVHAACQVECAILVNHLQNVATMRQIMPMRQPYCQPAYSFIVEPPFFLLASLPCINETVVFLIQVGDVPLCKPSSTA